MRHGKPWRLLLAACVAASGLTALTPTAALAADTVFHVATQGDDDAAGTEVAPFRTITRAQRAVREALPTATGPLRVRVRGGVYYLSEPLTFTPADSGATYEAAAGESVVLSGGRRLAPAWTTHQGATLVADIGKDLDFDELFLDGKRQVLARYPNFDPKVEVLNGYAADAISPARVAGWKNPTTALVRGLHQGEWGGNSFKVTGVDGNGDPKLQWVGDNNRGSGLHPQKRMVENVLEELDAPGEWFYDKAAGRLYLQPPAGVDPAAVRVETAEREELIRIVGDSPASPVHDLTFAGFTFTQTHRTLFSRPYEKLQLGDWAIARAGAVYLKNTRGITVRDARFDQVGGNAVFMDGYAEGNVVSGGDFRDSGASDIAIIGSHDAVRERSTWDGMRSTITDTTPGPKTEDYPRDITIADNYLTRNGRFEKQTSGVQISMSRRVTVSGNTVHDGPRACVDINDGTWGGHVIEDNDIFDCVKETSDHGPINSWGRDRFWPLTADDAVKKSYAKLDAMETTKIRHNRIWHSSHWDVDLDDGSSNYEVTGNLLLNGGVKLREGFFRTVRGNVFVNGGGHFHVSYADNGDVVEKNIFVTDDPYDFIQSDPSTSKTVYDDNLFWNNGKPVADITDAWRARGLDTRSVIGDPLFEGASPYSDPAKLDYSLKAGSPALALGFKPFAMTGFGKPGSPTPPPLTWRKPDSGMTIGNLAEPLMGATVTEIHSDEVKSSVGLTDYDGLFFAAVPADSHAWRQGLRTGDVIREIADVKVSDRNSFWKVYNRTPAGRPTALKVWRNQALTDVSLTKAAGVETIDNVSGVTYTGTGWDWKNDQRGGAGSTLGDLHATQTDGDAFELAFHGTGVEYIAQVNSDEGKVDLYLDGKLDTTIDNHNPTREYQKVVYTKTGLAPGPHTLKGVKKDGSYFIVDGFKIHTAPGGDDGEAPVTTASGVPSGWSSQPVQVVLTASDAGTGVERTEYHLGDDSWRAYTGPVRVDREGESVLTFRSVDRAGNVEESRSVAVRIDTTAPTLTVTPSPDRLWPPNHRLVPVEISLKAADAGPVTVTLVSITSSSAGVEDDVRGASYGTADTSFALRAERDGGADRVYRITYRVVDRAGNATVAHTRVSVRQGA
ncbi:Right handed beta helix region [Streptosporangium canum]|uniref:Right handed beta helix region n=1 Tax=Streptosporangium canum TaxID=324952 RepID=A0A1I4AIU7_9ACTN|nr:PDZ domain-containing protein [Streptosporangium canum]SFK56402.1 Right handed beta helix region [Streptosporangium canum]